MKREYYLTIKPFKSTSYTIHEECCPFLEMREKRIPVGEFDSALEALSSVLYYFPETTGCPFCTTRNDNMIPSENIKPITLNQISFIPQNLFFSSIN